MAPATISRIARASDGTSGSGIAWLLAGRDGDARGSLRLREDLLVGLALVELGRLAVGGRDAEGRLAELAGVEAVAAGVAFGLDRRHAAPRGGDLDDPRHAASSQDG